MARILLKMETLPELTSKHAGKRHHFPWLLSPWLFLALAACGAPRGKSDGRDESPVLKKKKERNKIKTLSGKRASILFKRSQLLGLFSSCCVLWLCVFYSNLLIVPLGWLTTLCKLSVLTFDIKKITYLHNQTHTQINKVTMCGI